MREGRTEGGKRKRFIRVSMTLKRSSSLGDVHLTAVGPLSMIHEKESLACL